MRVFYNTSHLYDRLSSTEAHIEFCKWKRKFPSTPDACLCNSPSKQITLGRSPEPPSWGMYSCCGIWQLLPRELHCVGHRHLDAGATPTNKTFKCGELGSTEAEDESSCTHKCKTRCVAKQKYQYASPVWASGWAGRGACHHGVSKDKLPKVILK